MDDLKAKLADLAAGLEVPEAPDVAEWTRKQLEAERAAPRPSTRKTTRRLIVAFAIVLACAVSASLVPSARTSVARLFHLHGVTVERVDALPESSVRGKLALGSLLTLERAQVLADFSIVLPDGQRPDQIYYSRIAPGGLVTLIYGSRNSPRLLVSEFVGSSAGQAFRKQGDPQTTVEPLDVHGSPGIWLSGGTHTFGVIDSTGVFRGFDTHLSGRTLVWERGRIIIRIEGEFARAEALKLAATFR